MKFHIISCGWFDSPYYAYGCVQRNVRSVLDQTFGRWFQFVVLDGGTTIDREHLLREFCKDERQYAIMPDERRGMASNLWNTISMIHGDPRDVLVFLDLDDKFAVDTALSVLAIEYEDPDCWMTHGSFRKLSGTPTGLNHALRGDVPIRCQRWCMSHCKSCRLGLYRKLKPADLKGPDGRFLRGGNDVAMMFALADMAGPEHIRFVPEVIYEYNDLNPNNVHKVSRDEQKRVDARLRRKAPKRRIKAYV